MSPATAAGLCGVSSWLAKASPSMIVIVSPGSPIDALDIRLAKLLGIGIGAMEDGHFPAPRAAEVVDVLVHEYAVAVTIGRSASENDWPQLGQPTWAKCSARLPPPAGRPGPESRTAGKGLRGGCR